jgi:hypothetical protein
MNEKIYRWETPGIYDQFPYGTEIIRHKSIIHSQSEVFKQISPDQERPKWESVSVVIGSTAFLNSPVCDRTGECSLKCL